MRLYLLRHGQVAQVTPRRFLGQRDVALDAHGIIQARAMGQALAQVSFDAVVCSDLERARQTARLVLAGRQLTATPTPLLREIALGDWEGLTVDEVRRQYPGEYERRGADMAGYRTPGGESFGDVQTRAVRFLHSLEPLSGDILAVAHGGFNRALLCHATGLDLSALFSIDQDYCGLNVLERTGDGWTVLGTNLRCGQATPESNSTPS
ncbi:MAG: histidine phosphatase family protein [Pseudodesulfovibrio sp.]|nr:histidine phosphatase family protein [Pseudomonadota bacterium]MBV1765796.1 histidine phosphatase family protein [Pseudodesulfovibrio sp.]MBU4242734.1 histidine phosphatase family protein [Pseudomonadota bacterium]MBU4379760.1 histidine phosphatase family protein [Pseudomonadota bacterium]MBU4474438.1 histidine phosphatase family protein [Pseudomonadota bacterium]